MARGLAWFIACVVTAAVLEGCEQQEAKILHYKAPHAVDVDDDADAAGNVRLLAAMVPHGNQTWFFKLQGPTDFVATHRAEFDRFMASVHFADGAAQPATFKAPAGWQQTGGAQSPRYATFQIGPKDKKTDLVITSFPGDVGGLLMNVNRWRKQIGLHPTAAARLKSQVKEIKVDGATAFLVDITGPGGSASSGMPPFMQGHPAIGGHPLMGGDTQPPADDRLHYQKPAGWEELTNPGPVVLKKFRAGSGDQAAEVSITPLGGTAGGLLANVNRWRAQIGLAPVAQAQVDRELQQIEVEDKASPYVDLVGPKLRMVTVIISRGEVTWFVKMFGPKDAVAEQKPAFEAFVKSLRFGAGDSHE